MHSNAEVFSAKNGRLDKADHRQKEASMKEQKFSIHSKSSALVVPSSYFAVKSVLGWLLALTLLLPGSLIILLLVALVRLTSRGPGIYCQVRVGRHGREFKMYKIRTMYQDAEARFGPEWTRKNDPRITPVGRWLRKLHLDEFPQLFNVLRGEMSVIGPRPERPEFTRVLAEEIPGYLDRLLVLPGITGLAQINLPPDMDINSVRRKLILDLEYIREASPLLDLRMFLSTLLRLFFINGDFSMKVMGLERDVPRIPNLPEVPVEEHHTPTTILSVKQTKGKTAVAPPHHVGRDCGHAPTTTKASHPLDDPLSIK